MLLSMRRTSDNPLTDKDMSVLREGDQAKIQRDKASGTLKDYSMKHHVSVRWDLNEDAIQDKMFELTIDDVKVILDSEEMMRFIRWV